MIGGEQSSLGQTKQAARPTRFDCAGDEMDATSVKKS